MLGSMIWNRRRWAFLVSVILVIEAGGVCLGAVLSIGHRGNSLFAPENTVSAFVACSNKADLVELDVQVSSDGALVIMHDATVDRTTDGTGSVSALTLAQLKTFDAGSWFSTNFVGERIPTLEESLAAILPGMTPLMEQKAGTAVQYVDELRRLNAVTNVVLQSFTLSFLQAVHTLEPAIPLCLLGSADLTATTLTNAMNAGARTVAWERTKVTATEVSLVHSLGMKLFIWTVDSPMEIQSFIDLGVDGIISDNPAAVKGTQEPPTNAPTYLGDGLVAYWKMDEGLTSPFATAVADSKGTNAGTLVRNDGASHWFDQTMARLGGCLKLEGTNAYVRFSQTPDLNINTNEFTFSAWIRLLKLPSQLATSYGAIFDSTTDCYVLYLDNANKELRFKITDTNSQAARPGILETFLVTNQWLHIGATFNGNAFPGAGQTVIYLNGQVADSHIGSDNTAGSGLTANVKTGQVAAMGREGPTGGNYFTGYVDDVAIWQRALAPSEIARIFQGGQIGQSVGELTRQSTSLIQIVSAQRSSSGTNLEIRFENGGGWSTFQLLRAGDCDGPFLIEPGLTPTALGGGQYRFDYPLTGNGPEVLPDCRRLSLPFDQSSTWHSPRRPIRSSMDTPRTSRRAPSPRSPFVLSRLSVSQVSPEFRNLSLLDLLAPFVQSSEVPKLLAQREVVQDSLPLSLL